MQHCDLGLKAANDRFGCRQKVLGSTQHLLSLPDAKHVGVVHALHFSDSLRVLTYASGFIAGCLADLALGNLAEHVLNTMCVMENHERRFVSVCVLDWVLIESLRLGPSR